MSLLRLSVLLLGLLPFLPVAASALEILAISPSTAAVGSSVNVTGEPFSDEALVRLGDRVVRPETITSKQMTFVVPDLPAGDYLLTLQDGDTVTEWPMLLRVVKSQPVILSLDPLRVDLCSSGGERRITVAGRSFSTGARVLVDGAQLLAEQTSSSRIDFSLPNLEPGMHRVEVVNPDGNRSLPFAVLINGVPEILSVVTGEDRVISYDLVIHGRNFPANVDLLVNGASVKAAIPLSGKHGGGRDSVAFVDCRTLLYTRFPVAREPSELALVVLAPSAEEQSQPFYIAAP